MKSKDLCESLGGKVGLQRPLRNHKIKTASVRLQTVAVSLRHTRVEDMIVAQVEDLNVVVELQQVAELGRVLQTVELVVCQVQLSQVHIHLQSCGCKWQNWGLQLRETTAQP